MGCEYTSLAPFLDDSKRLTSLYIEHHQKGKQLGYTPVLMRQDMELEDYYWNYFHVPMSAVNYPALVKTILQQALSKPYDAWRHDIYEKYLLDLQEGEDEEYERNLVEELTKIPSDEQYEAQVKSKPVKNLMIQKSGYWALSDDGCRLDEYDVLALIPASHSYETLAWLPIGGFNWCPTPEYQVAFAKYFFETYGADVMSVRPDQVEFYLNNSLLNQREVIEAARELTIMDNDKYQDMEINPGMVYGKQWLYMWWD